MTMSSRAARSSARLVPALLSLLLLVARSAWSDEASHVYNDMEEVILWADKIGPVNNPHETYPYSHVPICELWGAPDEDWGMRKHRMWIGEALEGHSFVRSRKIEVSFGIAVGKSSLCSMTLSAEQANLLVRMVAEQYRYVYFVDDLPLQGDLGDLLTVGQNNENEPEGEVVPMIYTHRTLAFQRNGQQIIAVDIVPSSPEPIKEGAVLNFTFQTEWSVTDVKFRDRFNRYLEESFFEHRVHWFSVVNSVVLCIFLCAVVIIILTRTLKNDFAKYAASEAAELESLDRADESGWKQVHGDVFRRPNNLACFSAVVGCGCHIGTMVFVVSLLALVNSYYSQRGMTVTATFMAYAATQFVSGAFGGYTFRLYGGKGWRRAMLLQLVALPVLALFLFCNTWIVASAYQSSLALPLNRLLGLVCLFFFVCLPLQLIGTRWGRSRASHQSFPCRVHQLKRPIPPKSWGFFPAMMSTAGLVPFGCVFVEMYFLFQSIWSYNKFYYVYGFILVILLLFCCVLVCVSITCTYVLLRSEDYRWAWTSVCCCASTAVYVFLYAIYYFQSTHMSGLLQSVHYFSSTAFLCSCLALFAGSVGYFGAWKFVNLIYRNIKSD